MGPVEIIGNAKNVLRWQSLKILCDWENWIGEAEITESNIICDILLRLILNKGKKASVSDKGNCRNFVDFIKKDCIKKLKD